jgi:hypothetical protein
MQKLQEKNFQPPKCDYRRAYPSMTLTNKMKIFIQTCNCPGKNVSDEAIKLLSLPKLKLYTFCGERSGVEVG